MSLFRALKGHKVEKEDDLVGFLNFYNRYNQPMTEDPEFDFDEIGEFENMLGWRGSLELARGKPYESYVQNRYKELKERVLRIREKYALKKGVCYIRVKANEIEVKGENNDYDNNTTQIVYDKKKVGTLIGAKLMSHVPEIGYTTRYWLVKFSDRTVTFYSSKNDIGRKWFKPCDPQPSAKTRKGRKQRRKQTRRSRRSSKA